MTEWLTDEQLEEITVVLSQTIPAISFDDVLKLYNQAKEANRLCIAKDNAYAERNKCVVGLMLLARDLGYKVGWAKHPEEDTEWEDDWRNIAVIELPTGQLTWHFHDSERWMLYSFEPLKDHQWDGHSTEEKYRRLFDYTPWQPIEAAPRYKVVRVKIGDGEYYAQHRSRSCSGSCSPPGTPEHSPHFHDEWVLCFIDGEEIDSEIGQQFVFPDAWRPLEPPKEEH